MTACLNSDLRTSLATVPRPGYMKTFRIQVGFFPEVWVSAFWRDVNAGTVVK